MALGGQKEVPQAQRQQLLHRGVQPLGKALVRQQEAALGGGLGHTDSSLVEGGGEALLACNSLLSTRIWAALAAMRSRSRPMRTSSSYAATSSRKSSTKATPKLIFTWRRADSASLERSASRVSSSAWISWMLA